MQRQKLKDMQETKRVRKDEGNRVGEWHDMVYKARHLQKMTERVLGESLLGVIRGAKDAGVSEEEIQKLIQDADNSVAKYWRNDRFNAEYIDCSGEIGGMQR